MEVSRLAVELELQALAYTTAMQDPSRVCDLHHSSWQHRIPDPLSEARDLTHILMDISQFRFRCTTTEMLHLKNFYDSTWSSHCGSAVNEPD